MGQIEILYNLKGIEGLHLIKPKIHYDNRGYFLESYNYNDLSNKNININFIQDNQIYSKRGSLRGLHYQINYPQTKLIRVIKGAIFDIVVDLRKNSLTYGKYCKIILSENNFEQLLIPKGFAHGFLTLSNYAITQYKCDEFYHPDDEGGIIYNDSTINIPWPSNITIFLYSKDKKWKTFKEIENSKNNYE